jgi:uncharacterized cupin superfamily protein
VGYAVFRADELHWDEPTAGDPRRRIARLSDAMANMRANVWRLSPDTRSRRHVERIQEEVFAVLEGTATLMLGDPPGRVDLACGSVAIDRWRPACAGRGGLPSRRGLSAHPN